MGKAALSSPQRAQRLQETLRILVLEQALKALGYKQNNGE